MGLTNIVLFAALLAIGAADIVNFTPCEESNDDMCKVSDVRITPCPSGKTCIFPQGSDASISFDFTPNFATSNLKTMVYWAQNPLDIPFEGFGSDNACDYTSCPTVPGQAQTLNFSLHVGKKLPRGLYPSKWKVWNPDNQDEKCCFRITIKLTKAKKQA